MTKSTKNISVYDIQPSTDLTNATFQEVYGNYHGKVSSGQSKVHKNIKGDFVNTRAIESVSIQVFNEDTMKFETTLVKVPSKKKPHIMVFADRPTRKIMQFEELHKVQQFLNNNKDYQRFASAKKTSFEVSLEKTFSFLTQKNVMVSSKKVS
jgi:hypothetical protein